MEIRLIQSDDWQGLYDLIEPIDKQLVGMMSDTEELVEDWVNNIVMGLWEVYVAVLSKEEIEEEGRRFIRKVLPWKRLRDNPSGIVGLVTLFGDWQEEEDLVEGDFDIGITVAEGFQRKGIGKELMKYILKRGHELKFKRARLCTRIDNFGMKKLAQKLGFEDGEKTKKNGYFWVYYSKDLEKKENRISKEDN